jgi:hypothetical protein
MVFDSGAVAPSQTVPDGLGYPIPKVRDFVSGCGYD